MQWSKTLTMVEAHAEREVGRVITGGVLDIPGKSMLDKMNTLNQGDDTLRRFCVFEPRGCAQMSTNVVLPPTRDDADISTFHSARQRSSRVDPPSKRVYAVGSGSTVSIKSEWIHPTHSRRAFSCRIAGGMLSTCCSSRRQRPAIGVSAKAIKQPRPQLPRSLC